MIENFEIAQSALKKCNCSGIKIENNLFIFNQYDYYDGIHKHNEVVKVENEYKKLLQEYYERIAKEKLIADMKRLEELKRIEEEKQRIEEEKRVNREAKKEQIIKNAKKQGYVVKKEVSKDNTIKLVLQKRVY
jgi:hypothetical protein